jgi:hypothetical protein
MMSFLQDTGIVASVRVLDKPHFAGDTEHCLSPCGSSFLISLLEIKSVFDSPPQVFALGVVHQEPGITA